MKLSVILGLVQMGFGVILKACNAVFVGSRLDFFFEFVPQLMFMASIFFYMDFLIIFKWLKDWTGQ
jgi:V-type H+-transporting ATPase subunit a